MNGKVEHELGPARDELITDELSDEALDRAAYADRSFAPVPPRANPHARKAPSISPM